MTARSLAGHIRVLVNEKVYTMDDGKLMRAPLHLSGYAPHYPRDAHEWVEVGQHENDDDVALAALMAAYLEGIDPPNHEGG